MLDEQCKEYLKSRGYTDPLITEEGWFTCGPGTYTQYGLQVTLKESFASVLCKTPTGRITALQIVNPRQKEYRRFRTEAGNYLPVYYASNDDFFNWETTGQVFLVEGIFDRIALRRCIGPGVFALLGLGMSAKMAGFLARHSKRVWLMLDQDDKGKEATKRVQNALKACGVAAVESIEYPEKDPGEMYKKRGQVRMSRFLEQQISLGSW